MKTIIGIKVSPVIMRLYSHLSQKHYEYFGFIFETVAIVGLFPFLYGQFLSPRKHSVLLVWVWKFHSMAVHLIGCGNQTTCFQNLHVHYQVTDILNNRMRSK